MTTANFPLTLSALDPATAPIDSSNARERLAFVAQFARLVRFYNLDNQVVGDWQAFLLKDASILLASIAATDYHSLHAQYEALTHTKILPADAQQAMLPALLRLLQEMFGTLAHWFTWLEWQDETFPLRAFMTRVAQEQLAPNLAHIHSLHKVLAVKQLLDEPEPDAYRAFAALRQLSNNVSASATKENNVWTENADSDRIIASAVTQLQHCYLDTLDVMVQIVDAASNHYEQVAQQPTPHPDTALLRVFVDLMQYQQNAINSIGKRHLDFYYQDVLQIEKRPAEADQVVVFLTPAAGQPCVTLPAGTRFAAGKDSNGAPVFYANSATAVVNSARIAAAFSLKANSLQSGNARFAHGIHATRLADVENLQHDHTGHLLDQPVFGNAATPAQGLGFALASPMLLLEGGSRRVVLTCELAADTHVLPDGWTQGWQCWLTHAEGWFDASRYAMPPHCEPAQNGKPSRLVLELILPPEAPPIQAASKPLDGSNSPWPRIRFGVSPTASPHPWPCITAIQLDVKVRDLHNLQLWNGHAPLTAGAAMPFGPVPQIGNRFFIGNREIFAKPTDQLALTLEWANLPGSLGEWYREYNEWQEAQRPDWPLLNDTAHAGTWQGLQQGNWQTVSVSTPDNKPADILFQGNSKSIFTFKLDATQSASPSLAQGTFPSPQEAAAGYLSFTLQTPLQAFGHQQYPQVLVWNNQQHALKLMQAAASGQAAKLAGMPNPPFTPVLKSVSAEYSASCRWTPNIPAGSSISVIPVEWFHYGPWLTWQVWQAGTTAPKYAVMAPGLEPGGLTLVPRVAEQGCLLLAVNALQPPCSLRLFANIADDGGARGFDAWMFSATGWQPLDVWRDDSAGLSGSGMLELSIPGDGAELPLAPGFATCTWLAITPRDTWRPLRLSLLASQAVLLERENLAADCEHLQPLAPGSIQKPPLPQLAAVRQPLPSHGGRAAETRNGYHGANNYYQRVSQHLLHKARALTPRDYVLQAHELMPSLYRVLLLPTLPQAPGEVRLGVIPRIASAATAGAFHPRLAPDQREQLAGALQSRGSSTARVSVHNLAPREIILSAVLILTPDAQAAWPSLRHEWNLALRLYLSPWIDSALPQYSLQHGLGRADLLQRLARFPGVVAIESLNILLVDEAGKPMPCLDERLPLAPGELWVSALHHQLTLAGA